MIHSIESLLKDRAAVSFEDVNRWFLLLFKGLVHPKRKILSLITRSKPIRLHSSSEHK